MILSEDNNRQYKATAEGFDQGYEIQKELQISEFKQRYLDELPLIESDHKLDNEITEFLGTYILKNNSNDTVETKPNQPLGLSDIFIELVDQGFTEQIGIFTTVIKDRLSKGYAFNEMVPDLSKSLNPTDQNRSRFDIEKYENLNSLLTKAFPFPGIRKFGSQEAENHERVIVTAYLDFVLNNAPRIYKGETTPTSAFVIDLVQAGHFDGRETLFNRTLKWFESTLLYSLENEQNFNFIDERKIDPRKNLKKVVRNLRHGIGVGSRFQLEMIIAAQESLEIYAKANNIAMTRYLEGGGKVTNDKDAATVLIFDQYVSQHKTETDLTSRWILPIVFEVVSNTFELDERVMHLRIHPELTNRDVVNVFDEIDEYCVYGDLWKDVISKRVLDTEAAKKAHKSELINMYKRLNPEYERLDFSMYSIENLRNNISKSAFRNLMAVSTTFEVAGARHLTQLQAIKEGHNRIIASPILTMKNRLNASEKYRNDDIINKVVGGRNELATYVHRWLFNNKYFRKLSEIHEGSDVEIEGSISDLRQWVKYYNKWWLRPDGEGFAVNEKNAENDKHLRDLGLKSIYFTPLNPEDYPVKAGTSRVDLETTSREKLSFAYSIESNQFHEIVTTDDGEERILLTRYPGDEQRALELLALIHIGFVTSKGNTQKLAYPVNHPDGDSVIVEVSDTSKRPHWYLMPVGYKPQARHVDYVLSHYGIDVHERNRTMLEDPNTPEIIRNSGRLYNFRSEYQGETSVRLFHQFSLEQYFTKREEKAVTVDAEL